MMYACERGIETTVFTFHVLLKMLQILFFRFTKCSFWQFFQTWMRLYKGKKGLGMDISILVAVGVLLYLTHQSSVQ